MTVNKIVGAFSLVRRKLCALSAIANEVVTLPKMSKVAKVSFALNARVRYCGSGHLSILELYYETYIGSISLVFMIDMMMFSPAQCTPVDSKSDHTKTDDK